MTFRELKPQIASQLMDYCEANGIEYTIWNAEEVWMGTAEVVEFGCDWDKVQVVLK